VRSFLFCFFSMHKTVRSADTDKVAILAQHPKRFGTAEIDTSFLKQFYSEHLHSYASAILQSYWNALDLNKVLGLKKRSVTWNRSPNRKQFAGGSKTPTLLRLITRISVGFHHTAKTELIKCFYNSYVCIDWN